MGTNRRCLWSPESSPDIKLSCQLLLSETASNLCVLYVISYMSRALHLLKDCYCFNLQTLPS